MLTNLCQFAGIKYIMLKSYYFFNFQHFETGSRTDRIDDFRFLREWRDDDVTAPDFHLDEELSTIL